MLRVLPFEEDPDLLVSAARATSATLLNPHLPSDLQISIRCTVPWSRGANHVTFEYFTCESVYRAVNLDFVILQPENVL